jgi:surface carbohydrate biosynthesis protein
MPVIYLPIEMLNRELDVRVELAKHLTGSTVVIGQQWSLFQNVKNIPKGTVLFKTVNAIQGRNMAFWRACGHRVVALDEEAILAADGPGMVSNVHPIAMDNCDLFLANNAIHAQAISERFPNVRIEVAGNQRIDVCRGDSFKAEGDKIREAYGPFILINTNFGIVNSIWGGYKGAAEIYRQSGFMETPEDVARFGEEAKWELANIGELIKLIRELERTHKIIIRPHPQEKASLWKDMEFNGKVIENSPPLPWLWASELLIHTSCTTGLEAAIMGKPAINLEPKIGPKFEPLTTTVNPTARTATAALEMVKATIDMEPYTEKARAFFPEGSTETIAKHILQDQPESELDFSKYSPIDRTDIQRRKFSLSLDRAKELLGPDIKHLDDSLFVRI